MSDKEFERPGAAPRPNAENWPYHVPTPAEPTFEALLDDTPAEDPAPRAPRQRRLRLLVAVVVGLLTGALVGGVWVAGMLHDPPTAQEIRITLDTFPRKLLGAQRNDIPLREAGFGPTVDRLDAEFAEQLASHRFAYGGEGATFGYGRLSLTILSGILPSALPRDGTSNRNGRVTQTRRLISLRNGDVSCTFEPRPEFNPLTGLEELGDFSSEGRTECVLIDAAHNLSLRISQVRANPGSDALETSASFRDELVRLRATLVG